jgi:hypothetical protein
LTGYRTLKHSNYQSTNYCTAIVINPTRTVMANIAPYWLATGTPSLLTNGTRNRLAAPVMQTPSTAVPLYVTRARVNRIIPVPYIKKTQFLINE